VESIRRSFIASLPSISFLHHYTLRSRLPERAPGRGAASSSASRVLSREN
jgi:hypothetical protein